MLPLDEGNDVINDWFARQRHTRGSAGFHSPLFTNKLRPAQRGCKPSFGEAPLYCGAGVSSVINPMFAMMLKQPR